MSDAPPPPFAAYPRGQSASRYGSSEKLQALADGYYKLSYVFVVNVLLAIAINTLTQLYGYSALLAGLPLIFIVISRLSYPPSKKIAFGKDWSNRNAVLASLLIGLNAALCCGIIGYAVMQQIAANEMIRYGLKPGLFTMTRGKVAQVISDLRAAELADTVPVQQIPPPQV